MRLKSTLSKVRKHISKCLIFLLFAGVFLVTPLRSLYAGCGCTGCVLGDCPLAVEVIAEAHVIGEEIITEHITDQFSQHRDWMLEDFFEENILPALGAMAEQLSAVGMQQVMTVGMFIDAKHQLETQRLFQELQNEAHKDYQPSEDFCWFGTNIRSMAASEQIGKFNALALNSRQMARHLANAGAGGAGFTDDDKLARWRQFTNKYCDPEDNNKVIGQTETGLTLACGTGGGDTDRINIDIDFTRLIDQPRTLEVALLNPPAQPGLVGAIAEPTADEEDVMALGNNLYGHEVLRRNINPDLLGKAENQHLYLALRSVAAKRSVAENSYNSIVGMKSSGTSDFDGENEPKTREFLGAIMTELGVPESEVYDLIGENPSYYAQLEMLAKRIYQNPDFFSNLYDKPANVERKSVALKAIDLMLDRAIYESQLRQEMAMSVLLSSRLRGDFSDADTQLSGSGR